jgi:required for meiotic nuclear division protein 1
MSELAYPETAASAPPLAGERTVAVRAVLLGERLDTRGFEQQRLMPAGPATLKLGDGHAVLFRYGAVVLFDVPDAEERSLLASLATLIADPYDVPDRDTTRVVVRPDAEERVDAAGTIVIKDASVERLQVIAHILGKSLALAHHEASIAGVFDRIEPLAAELQRKGRVDGERNAMVRQIGNVLSVQHRMVGRVETREKPDLLWDHPELERLYARLAEDYELTERDQGLDRKLELISRTAVTLQGLLQNRSFLRLEWYVILLIVTEIAISIYSTLR